MKRALLILCLAAGPAFSQIGAPNPLPNLTASGASSLIPAPKGAAAQTIVGKPNFYPNRDWSAQAGQGQAVYYGGVDSKRTPAGTSVITNGQVCTQIWGGRLICR